MTKAEVDALGCGENAETGKGGTKRRVKREKNECGQGDKAEVSVKSGARRRTKGSNVTGATNSDEKACCAESEAEQNEDVPKRSKIAGTESAGERGEDTRCTESAADSGKAAAESAAVTEDTLAKYLSRLLGMSAGETAESAELCGAESGSQNQAMTLVQSIVSKAIEKGDVAAFKEIRGMLASGDESGSYIERLLCALCHMLEENRLAGAEETDALQNTSGAQSEKAGAEKVSSPEDAVGKRRAGDGGALAGRPQEPE